MTDNLILDTFRMSADELWADTMTAWFAVAEGLYVTGHGDLIPAEWEFRAACGIDRADYLENTTLYGEDILALLDAGDTAPVLYAGRVFTAYANLLTAAGHSY